MISAVILTKNEARDIGDCIKSLSWCDEIIIVDDNSDDKTIEIAKNMQAKVYKNTLTSFSDQRNFALEKATGDWILFLDADERVSPALCFEIMQYINDPADNFAGFYFSRKDFVWGKELKHGEAGSIKMLRLAKKYTGKWKGNVHERWEISGTTHVLTNPLQHFPHQKIDEFLSEINYYTDLRAEELFKQKVKTNWFLIILYSKAKFIQNYFFKLGFLDGLPGLVAALMMSFHSFLVRSKLWLLWQKVN